METSYNDFIAADVLIIGSGLAGLLAALELMHNGKSVVLVTKASLIDSNTSYAQGGLAAVTTSGAFDSKEAHLNDTVKAGAGLTDFQVAKSIIDDGEKLIRSLATYGVRFDCKNINKFDLAREGGHSYARVLHHKDATGKAISQTLSSCLLSYQYDELRQKPKLVIFENTFVTDLIVDNGACLGAIIISGNSHKQIAANSVVIATGGIGQIFARTTNPKIATADGIALAYRAGAHLIDMEFVQFHPTALYMPGAPATLISEAVRGAGAVLLDAHGQRFATRFHPNGELATRDVVARAIHTIMEEQHVTNVFLDLRPIGRDKLRLEFPNIIEICRKSGIDPEIELVPISPAAHYFMGGIWTTASGLTTLENLYAIGESACTGLHGANRLASNSLLEAGVMGMRVARHILDAGRSKLPLKQMSLLYFPNSQTPVTVPTDIGAFRQAMYTAAGLVRTASELNKLSTKMSTKTQLLITQTPKTISIANMLLVGQLIVTAALKRQESRGAHYRADFPAVDNENYRKRLSVSRSGWEWIDEPYTKIEVTKQQVLSA